MAGKTTPQHIKERIREILLEDGWNIRQGSASKATWAFIAEDRRGRKIGVGQNKGREDQVIIQGAVTIDDVTNNKLNQLSEEEYHNFLWDLRFELLRTDLEFEGIEMPLKRVAVKTRIFLDALAKDTFLLRTSQVRKGVLLILWMVARKFAQQPPKRQLGFQR